MKTKYLIILVISSFCVIVLLLFNLVMNTAFGNLCENSIVSEVSSDKYTATVFTRGCGATTSEYPYINIRKKSEDIDDSESLSKKQVFLSITSEQAQIRWIDNSVLTVGCQGCLRDGIDEANPNVEKVFKDLQIKLN